MIPIALFKKFPELRIYREKPAYSEYICNKDQNTTALWQYNYQI